MRSLVAVMMEQIQSVRKTHQATAVQAQFLRSLLKVHQPTELGRHYKLADIQTVKQNPKSKINVGSV